MNAFDKIVSRLHNVRVAGDRASAGCPICNSRRGRPLAIKATTDGRVLLHGFCGHSTDEILRAVGLTLADLFDGPRGEHAPLPRSPWTARDVLELAMIEVHVVGIVAADILQRRAVSERDWERLSKASSRLLAMVNEVQR
jgi:hypothetical protein